MNVGDVQMGDAKEEENPGKLQTQSGVDGVILRDTPHTRNFCDFLLTLFKYAYLIEFNYFVRKYLVLCRRREPKDVISSKPPKKREK